MSNNSFDISGDLVRIHTADGMFHAVASIRDDYRDELMSVTWGKNGKYFYNAKLGYLHRYIMEKWYTKEILDTMTADNFVVDHMDGDGFNCNINNLCFLSRNENVAKGNTLDIECKNTEHIALKMFKDFQTELIQITIFFNYPAKLILEGLERDAVVELAFLLYDADYRIVINDARLIMLDYRNNYEFIPNKLRFIDYQIEGSYGVAPGIKWFEEYISGKHGHGVALLNRVAPIKNWTKEKKREYISIR